MNLVVRGPTDEAVCLVTFRNHTLEEGELRGLLHSLAARLGLDTVWHDHGDVLDRPEWDTLRELTGLPTFRATSLWRDYEQGKQWFLFDYSDDHDAITG